MLRQTLAIAAVFFGTWPATAQTQGGGASSEVAGGEEEPVRTVEEWNLAEKTRLAISGYDPVAYFPEGGGAAVKGKPGIEFAYKGAVYRFASEANRERFKAEPRKYEPAYGGWCAWAMLDGEKVEVDPKSFIVRDSRLFLFFDGFFADTRAKWQRADHDAEEAKADARWKSISGEDPPATVEETPKDAPDGEK